MTRSATRERLFAAAIELIAESGLAATTVDQIAARAGVAKGTVYYNFGSKAELFSALLEFGVERLAATLRDAVAGRPPLEALEAAVAAELAFIGEHEPFARLLIAETWRSGGDWQRAARLIRERAVEVLAGALRDAVAAGVLRRDLDVATAASAVFGMVLTVALDWRALQPERPVDDVRATLMDLLRGRLVP
ncbi:TetR/AcrR family transcriptional regulator [Actinomadura parmotrematis]|uniref:TetR/AcrR family transcriptional regulator n=1 Tax=Actinomadura parmotrematis TaxID=2864039 RepID=A0ABS7G4D1_9ACTN|nr:TetR/AcrR family transcriptional regulator [Actinomadura parmotrematis]MBW8487582.1 TetR/AcrR family transcriptional regulator [Actinomadura parmotrematis]